MMNRPLSALSRSESDAGEATTTGSEMSAPSRHALCQARQLARQTASAAAQQQPKARQAVQLPQVQPGAASSCCQQLQHGIQANPLKLQLRCLDGIIMGCDRSAAQQAAACQAPPAGGDLARGRTFRNLNGRSRAHSILQTINVVPSTCAASLSERSFTWSRSSGILQPAE